MTDIREMAREKTKQWTIEGYDVSVLTDALDTGTEEQLEELLDDYQARILRLKRAGDVLKKEEIVLLSSMDTTVFNQVKEINKALRDPAKVLEAETAVIELENTIKERQVGSRMTALIDGLTEKVADDKGRGERVRDIFVVYSDGRLLYHLNLEGRRSVDTDILSGMLTAIQDFVGHCLQYDSGEFRKLEYGNLKLLVEKGKKIYVAYITSGAIPLDLPRSLRTLVGRIETRFGDTLEFWDGDVDSLRGISKIVKTMTEGKD